VNAGTAARLAEALRKLRLFMFGFGCVPKWVNPLPIYEKGSRLLDKCMLQGVNAAHVQSLHNPFIVIVVSFRDYSVVALSNAATVASYCLREMQIIEPWRTFGGTSNLFQSVCWFPAA
jgi:hypothetical protein